MILAAAAFLSLLSVFVFAVGMLSDRPDVAMLGAIIMIGLGVTVVFDGMQVRVGEERFVNNTTGGDEVITVNGTYDDVQVYSGFPMYPILLLLGAVMFIGATGEASDAGARKLREQQR